MRCDKRSNGKNTCACGSVSRREALQWMGLGAAALASGLPVMAGPYTREDFAKMVPADKKLDAAWVKSLFERGRPAVYRGAELSWIGLPIGGLCSGQLYLGGDGRLWRWDVFNQTQGTGDQHYRNPPRPGYPVAQGFAVRIGAGADAKVRTLDQAGFKDVSFRGEYPIGRVEYREEGAPVSVTLEAYSPFIPLSADDSSLPATVLQFTVKNDSAAALRVELGGWLQNAVCVQSVRGSVPARENRVVRRSQRETGGTGEASGTPAGMLAVACGMADSADKPIAKTPAAQAPDFGTMALALLEPGNADRAIPGLSAPVKAEELFAAAAAESAQRGDSRLAAGVVRTMDLPAGGQATATFVIAWHFPNLRLKDGGRHYAKRFPAAVDAAGYVAANFARLAALTRLWRDTWYDSTLPYWFLDRTMVNTSILATSTAHRFGNGRFYGWEGVGCCEGTCTHVWHYAHAVARLFPELERDLRTRTDFGTAQTADGMIHHRGEGHGQAVDGQAGCILRAYREHQMSPDDALLKSLWPKIKRAMEYLVRMDRGAGMLEGSQHNTLDQAWFGKIAWLSSLYLAAARACEEMAKELGDEPYAARMCEIVARGGKSIDRELFNGEYYLQIADKDHVRTVGSHNGCEIDQCFGQSWAWQVGLGRILDEGNVKKALAALWRYNFTPDVGPFREKNKPGRWYALAGDGGLLMCSWPQGDAARVQTGYDYYFNECMTGFEYQVAGHMIWEGMVQEGLAIARAIHDRYHPLRRNPYNEVECGDHYARAMASYGVYLAACGFEYHGPKGHIGLAPRLTPEDFKAAFTAAEGWGTLAQRSEGGRFTATLELKHGRLRLKTISLVPKAGQAPTSVTVRLTGKDGTAKDLPARHELKDGRLTVTLEAEATIEAPGRLEVVAG